MNFMPKAMMVLYLAPCCPMQGTWTKECETMDPLIWIGCLILTHSFCLYAGYRWGARAKRKGVGALQGAADTVKQKLGEV